MELQQLIEKWEQEMADRLKWIENEKDLVKRYIHISAYIVISDMLANVKQLNLPPVSNSLPVDFLQNEMIKAIKELAKESTAPDKETPAWLESDIKRGAKWMYKRLTECTIHDVNTYAKLRKALETIRDAYYTNGETDKEKVNDLKAIAFNVLYEIDNN